MILSSLCKNTSDMVSVREKDITVTWEILQYILILSTLLQIAFFSEHRKLSYFSLLLAVVASKAGLTTISRGQYTKMHCINY